MIRKFIAYQRLLLNSIPPIGDSNSKFSFGKLIILIVIINIINENIFAGNIHNGDSFMFIDAPILIVMMISKILNSNFKLYETVPVNRKYILINIFLLPIVLIVIFYIVILIFNGVFIGLLFGILYLVYPQGFSESPPEIEGFQIINSTNGYLLMLCLFLIIIFVGITITLIRNKKQRLFSYGGFAIIGYILLFFLKSNMAVSPNTGRVEFVDSFSLMPNVNIILISIAIATLFIVTASSLISYRLFVRKGNINKNLI